ncbi:hypothetical protein SteCoe_39032 [Stentor coeruleus]|uniref:Uncharacterized protein n=1 Tax=Stentor coeruleus TaxID=5963 RepID=A0A1R2AKW0_9CILI|nr:hypothetical protein SteCoe_39032 [Stentor coeruleus]
MNVKAGKNNQILAKSQAIEYNYGLLLQGHIDEIQTFTLSKDNRLAISGSKDKTVRVWNLENKHQEAVFYGHSSYINIVSITSDNYFILSGSGSYETKSEFDDNSIRVWNLHKKSSEAIFLGHPLGVKSLAITNSDHYIVSGSSDNYVRVWRLPKKQENVPQSHY